MVDLKSPREIEIIRRSGIITAQCLEMLKNAVKEGVTTLELDILAESFIRKHGGIPAFLGYRGYPKTLCVSINEEVVHGIPSNKRVIKNGDVVGLDMGVILDGYYSDSAVTVTVGTISKEKELLVRITREALYKGIEQAVKGNRIGDVSAAIQKHAESHGFSVVRELTGHGVGRSMHEEPMVPNFVERSPGIRLKPGMVFAIEPMVNIGGFKLELLDDGWTYVTRDRSISAHFEHTIAVTENGPAILTLPE